MSDARGTDTDTHPAIERDVAFDQCLSFTVRGDWGHFRRVGGNIVKQTYRVMPRTTVAGLCAAVCGYPRDSYYELFAADASAIAVEPVGDQRTVNIPENVLSTAEGQLTDVTGRKQTEVSITVVDPTKKKRQQHNYEVLVDPAYRLHVWLDDDEAYETLRTHLAEGTTVYTPALGLSEHLASVTEFEEQSVTHDVEAAVVDSALPTGTRHLAATTGVRYATESSAGFMRVVNDSRRTTGFIDWAYTPADEPLPVTDTAPVSRVGDSTVVFV